MKSLVSKSSFFPSAFTPGLIASLALAGCERNDIQVYRVAKDDPQSQTAGEAASAGPVVAPMPVTVFAKPQLQWKLPAGWQEQAPGEMRAASFRVPGKAGKQADVSVVPLGGMAGGAFNNVNRWRGQVGLEPVQESELPKSAEPVTAGGQPAQLYDLAGTNPSSGDPTRILAAIQMRGGTAWFFKMIGDDKLVAGQKPAFIQFLESLSFAQSPGGSSDAGPVAGGFQLPAAHPPIDAAALASTPVAGDASSQPKPKWRVPAGWQETSGQFLVAKFLITGPADARAAVNVSLTGGGLAANVNRWRRQLGLQALPEEGLDKQMTSLDTAGGTASLVDLSGVDAASGQKARLIGLAVPQQDQMWYYKLMGNPQLVSQQKDAFLRFVQTADYSSK